MGSKRKSSVHVYKAVPVFTFVLMFLACNMANAQTFEPVVKPGTKHLALIKKFVATPKWKGVKRCLKKAKKRESTVQKKDDFRDERGHFPFHSTVGSDKKVKTDLLFVALGTPSRVKYIVTGFSWTLPSAKEQKRGRRYRSKQRKNKAPLPQWNDDKRVAVAVLKQHKVQFAAAGFKVLAQKDHSVRGWIKIEYRLSYKGVEFTIIVEHEGSGMNFDFASSRGGYVHFSCCMKPEDCSD
jgi:hypothetical protein